MIDYLGNMIEITRRPTSPKACRWLFLGARTICPCPGGGGRLHLRRLGTPSRLHVYTESQLSPFQSTPLPYYPFLLQSYNAIQFGVKTRIGSGGESSGSGIEFVAEQETIILSLRVRMSCRNIPPFPTQYCAGKHTCSLLQSQPNVGMNEWSKR